MAAVRVAKPFMIARNREKTHQNEKVQNMLPALF